MDLDSVRTFVDVLRRGSFAAVARDRGVAASSISRSVAGLEHELGARLFHRTTRRLAPTDAGLAYYQRVEPLLEELEAARSEALESSRDVRGTLRLTAPVSFGQRFVVPALTQLAREHPRLSVDLRLGDRIVDLVEERMDAAIRLGRLPDSTLISRRLADMRYVVCASPAYLARAGEPKRPRELLQHECLIYPFPGQPPRWRFRRAGRSVEELPVQGRFTVSHGGALTQLALEGLGVLMIPRWNIQRELDAGSLLPLLSEYEATASDFGIAAWLLYPSRAYLPLKVRALAEALTRHISGALPRS